MTGKAPKLRAKSRLAVVVDRIELPPHMAVEVVVYPEVEQGRPVLRIGNRSVWTWAPLTPAQARKVAAALRAGADVAELKAE